MLGLLNPDFSKTSDIFFSKTASSFEIPERELISVILSISF